LSRRQWSRVKIPTSVVVTAVGIALTAWLLPAFTRQWDDRQKEHELKTALIAEVGSTSEGKVTAHTFRHKFASMLIVGMKADPVRVSRQLGHSDPATTHGVYSHEFEQARHADELRQGLGDRFGSLLARSS